MISHTIRLKVHAKAKPFFIMSFIFSLLSIHTSGTTYYSQGSSDPSSKFSWNKSKGVGLPSGRPNNFTSNDTFVIQNGHTMTPTGAWTVSGAQALIQLEDGAILVTGAFTTSTTYLTVLRGGVDTVSTGGTLVINGGVLSVSGIVNHKGTITLTSASTIINDGGKYQYNKNGGALLTATWSTGSVCEITGITSTIPTNLSQIFYHFIWNCSSQSSSGLSLGNTFSQNIKGSLTIQNTGSPTPDTLYLANTNSTSYTLAEDLIISSGAFFNLSLSTGSPYLILKGNLTVDGTLTKNVSGSGTPTISFVNTGTATFSKTGTISNTINFVDSIGTLDLGGNILTGSGKFSLLSRAGIIIGNVNGITSSGNRGNIQVTGTRTYSTSANYNYAGSTTQVFGNGLPSTVNDLTLNNGNKNMLLNGSLTVNGNLTLNNGNIAIGNNKLFLDGDFIGSASNSIRGNGISSSLIIEGIGNIGSLYFDQTTQGVTNRLQNLTINRVSQTITLANTLEITETITPTSGVLASAGNLKLISSATGTALIAAGNGSYITGNVTVQRYIPSSARRFRFLSSSIMNGTLEDWRNEMYLTGNNSPVADQSKIVGDLNWGFDATLSNNPSVYWYDETITTGNQNSGWAAVKNNTSSLANQPLVVGKGYRIFVRGDRSNVGRLDGSDNSQNTVTLDLKGPVNTGTISMPVSFTSSGVATHDGWCLLGNPYPCPFDWNALHDGGRSVLSGNYSGTNYANINPTAHIFNASTNTYNSYNALSDVYIGNGFQSGIIPSGAAFFVQASATPFLTFTENNKSTAITEVVFKTSEDNTLFISLFIDSLSSDDAVVKYMTGTTPYKDDYDIIKLTNPELNIASYGQDNLMLAANVRPFPLLTDSIPLSVKVKDAGIYKLLFKGISSFSSTGSFLLKDNYLNHAQFIYDDLEYAFSVNTGDSMSQGDKRFVILHGDSLWSTGVLDNLVDISTPDFYLASNMVDEITYLYTSSNSTNHIDIDLKDLSGKTVRTFSAISFCSTQPFPLVVSDLKSGMYFIQLHSHYSASNQVLKFVKK